MSQETQVIIHKIAAERKKRMGRIPQKKQQQCSSGTNDKQGTHMAKW